MIWVVGVDGDHTFHHVIRRCLAERAPFGAINLRAVLQRGSWCFPVTPRPSHAWIKVDGRTFVLDPRDAFFCRVLELDRIVHVPEARRSWQALVAGLSSWLGTIGGIVVNRPGHATDNAAKPHHEALLARAGFDVPAAIVSSNTRQLVAFAARGPTVVKSLSGARSDARQVTACELRTYCPARGPLHLQRLVEGHDVRAHVVHQEVFAVAIRSRLVDYRTGTKNTYAVVALPPALSRLVVANSREQGLELAGWDFKVDALGRYWCLECNPMPGFSGYDRHHLFALSGALLRRLQAGPLRARSSSARRYVLERAAAAPGRLLMRDAVHRANSRQSRQMRNIFRKKGLALATCCALMCSPDGQQVDRSAQEVPDVVRTLGLLATLAYVTASTDDQAALRSLGFDVDPHPKVDARFPARRAARDGHGWLGPGLGDRARGLFLSARANPVILHTAAIEAMGKNSRRARAHSAFVGRYAPSLKPFLVPLHDLVEEAGALFASRRALDSDLGAGAVRRLSEHEVGALRTTIASILPAGAATSSSKGATAVVSSLLPPMTGFNVVPAGSPRWIVVGPSGSEEDHAVLLAHELLHVPVHRLLGAPRLRWAIWRNRHKFAAIKRSAAGDQEYADWASFVEEGVVRALSYEVAGAACRDTGFLLESVCDDRARQRDIGACGLADSVAARLWGALP